MPEPLPPGRYLEKRREAAGLTLIDVALQLETVPAVSARSRAEWLAAIERGDAPLAIGTALALLRVEGLRFDWNVLLVLAAIDAGLDGEAPPRLCRVCACSERDPCVTARGPICACAWAAPDLCTRCAPLTAAPAAVRGAAA